MTLPSEKWVNHDTSVQRNGLTMTLPFSEDLILPPIALSFGVAVDGAFWSSFTRWIIYHMCADLFPFQCPLKEERGGNEWMRAGGWGEGSFWTWNGGRNTTNTRKLHSLIWLTWAGSQLSLFPQIPIGLETLSDFLSSAAYTCVPHPRTLMPLPSPFSLSLFCAIWVLRHVIFITSHLLHDIVMRTLLQALDIAQPKQDQWISFPSHFSSFNCSLSVVFLQLDTRDYTETSHVAFCPNKQRYFEPIVCLDLDINHVWEGHSTFKRNRSSVKW